MIPQAEITERKVKSDGSVHDYSCGLVHRSEEVLVIAYVMRRGGTLPGIGLPVAPGSVSYGYFWRDRPYNLYRMKRADGSIIAHRIDAVAGVHWSESLLEYRDLVLDWWLLADRGLIPEDEDELAEAAAAGTLSASDIAAAELAKAQVESGWRAIIAEAEALESIFERALVEPLQEQRHSP